MTDFIVPSMTGNVTGYTSPAAECLDSSVERRPHLHSFLVLQVWQLTAVNNSTRQTVMCAEISNAVTSIAQNGKLW